MVKKRIGRVAVALAAAGGLSTAGLVAFGGTAGADYGAGATYQIEVSANTHFVVPATPTAGTKKVSMGAGLWLWFALTPTASTPTMGAVDYAGSDCQHNVAGPPGAFGDTGTTTYKITGTTIVIGPISLADGALPAVTVTVPAMDGHYRYTSFSSVFSGTIPPITGNVQVQVAP